MDETVTQNTELLREALAGLRATPKELQPKWFYDSRAAPCSRRLPRSRNIM